MPVQELQFTRFYPSEANEQDWDILLNLLQVESKESNPDDPPPPEALHRKQIEAFDDNPFLYPKSTYYDKLTTHPLDGSSSHIHAPIPPNMRIKSIWV